MLQIHASRLLGNAVGSYLPGALFLCAALRHRDRHPMEHAAAGECMACNEAGTGRAVCVVVSMLH